MRPTGGGSVLVLKQPLMNVIYVNAFKCVKRFISGDNLQMVCGIFLCLDPVQGLLQ